MVDKKKLVIVCLCLVVTGFLSLAIQYRHLRTMQSGSLPLQLPMETANWHGSTLSAVLPREVGPGDFILRTYRGNDGTTVNVLALYSRISNYHPPALCYQGEGRQLTDIPALASSSGKIELAGLMGKRNYNTILVYHGFYVGGKVIPDGIGKKLHELKANVLGGPVQQYFIEVTINLAGEDPQQGTLHVKRFLDDMETYLLRQGGERDKQTS